MSEQVQLALIGVLASFVTTIGVGIANWIKTQQVHTIVNSRQTALEAQISRLTRIIALPSGPEKDRLMAELNLPAEDLVAAQHAAEIKHSQPQTGEQRP